MPTADDLADLPRTAVLSRSDLAVLARAGHQVRFTAGSRLIEEGQRADHCWLIIDGSVRLEAHVPGQGDIVIQTLGRGDFLGWSWLLPPRRWHFGARAVDLVTAVEFDADRLLTAAEADSGFGYDMTRMLFEALLERLQSTRARLLDLYRNPREPDRGRTGRSLP